MHIQLPAAADIGLQFTLMPLVRIIFDGKKTMASQLVLKAAHDWIKQNAELDQNLSPAYYLDYLIGKFPGLVIDGYTPTHHFEIARDAAPLRKRSSRGRKPAPASDFDWAVLKKEMKPYQMTFLETLVQAEGATVATADLLDIVRRAIGFKTMANSTLSRMFWIMCEDLDTLAPTLSARLEATDTGFRLRAA